MNIYFIRHGQTDKNPSDLERCLTPEGKFQALEKKKSLPLFDLAICSIAKRTMETAAIFCEKPPITMKSLYLPEGEKGVIVMSAFQRLGHVSLAKYLSESRINDMVLQYGLEGWEEITYAILEARANEQKPKNILVVGHAVLITAVVFAALMRNGTNEKDIGKLLNAVTEECDGFKIRIVDYSEKIYSLDII